MHAADTQAGAAAAALTGGLRPWPRRLAFWLQPYGFFDGDASGDLLEATRILPSRAGRGAQPLVVTPGAPGVPGSFQCVPADPRPAYSAAELQAL